MKETFQFNMYPKNVDRDKNFWPCLEPHSNDELLIEVMRNLFFVRKLNYFLKLLDKQPIVCLICRLSW